MQRNLGPVPPDSLAILPPLAVYDLDTSAIANGGGLEAARPNGRYLYLIESSGRYVITVEVMVDDSGNGTPVSWMNEVRGPGMTAGLQQLATLDQATSGSYEVRIIETPLWNGYGNQFFWLKSNTASPDLIYVINQQFLPDTLQVGEVYTAAEFLEIARPVVQQRMGMSMGRGGRGGGY
jgi:hypothetical protein